MDGNRQRNQAMNRQETAGGGGAGVPASSNNSSSKNKSSSSSSSSSRSRKTKRSATNMTDSMGNPLLFEYKPSAYLMGLSSTAASTAPTSTATTELTSTTTTNTTVYGLDIAPQPLENCCAACSGSRNQELTNDAVLLCDGTACGREFHLSCIIPAMDRVPTVTEDDNNNNWYCRDCCTSGAVGPLREYLEGMDDCKHDNTTNEFQDWNAFRESLWVRDYRDLGVDDPNTNEQGSTTTTAASPAASSPGSNTSSNTPPQKLRRPVSELEWAFTSHHAALAPVVPLPRKSRPRTPSKKARQSKAMASPTTTAAATPTVTVPETLTAATSLDDFCVPPQDASFFLGCPIRLYVPTANTYHTGRIVDYRPCTTTWTNTTNDNKVTEYLVRFCAGLEDRKTKYQHWMVLEEHALAVGTTLVWASFPVGPAKQHAGAAATSVFQPAILWFRTARELFPVQHMLQEGLGEIVFQDSLLHGTAAATTTANKAAGLLPFHIAKEALIRQWKLKAVVAMGRTFGGETYKLLSLEHDTVDLDDTEAVKQYGGRHSQEMKLLLATAQAERDEQERVRSWHSIKAGSAAAPRALTLPDEYALGNLMLENAETAGPTPWSHAAPCALVPQGVDRMKIAQLLERQGVSVTKELASMLTVDIAPVDMMRYNREQGEEVAGSTFIPTTISTAGVVIT